MRALLKPYWILVFITLPQVILLWSLSNSFQIVKTQISVNGISLWIALLSMLSISIGILSLYALITFLRKQETGIYIPLFILLFYIPLLYLQTTYESEICPSRIPRWMLVSGDPLFMVYSLVMPGILFAIFNLAVASFKNQHSTNVFPSAIAMLMVPLGWYLMFTVIIPLIRDYNFYSMAPVHIGLILMISGVVVFLFLIIRTVYGFIIRKNGTPLETTWLTFIIGLILPIAGLTTNALLITNFDGGIFGDFSNPLFFLLATVNGLVLLIPKQKSRGATLIIFAAKCALLPFSLYFFFVFLPYLPLSLLAILAFGLGFLILAPLLVTVIHIHQLYSDYKYLAEDIRLGKLIPLMLLCFVLIPAAITVNNISDRIAINQALEELFEKNPNELRNNVNKRRVLHVIETIKNNNQNSTNFSKSIPFIDQYYNWLVLDNLAIGAQKLAQLDVLFKGTKVERPNTPLIKNDDIKIESIKQSTRFNEKLKLYQTNVRLFIRGDATDLGMFATRFYFPKEYKLANYYLVINGKREPAILAEKKTSEWIFRQITRINKDPGIIRYSNFDSLQLNVFPFRSKELRESELEILHPSNLYLQIDGNKIIYDAAKVAIDSKPITINGITCIPGTYKNTLKLTQRKPYLHLLVDASSNESFEKNIVHVESILKNEEKKYDSIAISIVNVNITHCNVNNYQAELKKVEFEGAFRVGLAVKNSLLKNHYSQTKQYPIFYIVSDGCMSSQLFNSKSNDHLTIPKISNWIFEDGVQVLSPEPLRLYVYNNTQHPTCIDINGNLIENQASFSNEVKTTYINGKQVYLPNNESEDFLFPNHDFDLDEALPEFKKVNPITALSLLETYSSIFSQHSNKFWLPELKLAIENNILTSNTAFIVLENEAEKEVLKQKQKQVLAGKKSLDIEEANQMSEPPLLIFIIIGVVLFSIKLFRGRKINA